jgi:SnoaL-like domain
VTGVDQHISVIRRFFDGFNERRFADVAALFSDDAVLEHTLRRQERGGAGYLAFVRMWITAFPDAALTVVHIAARAANTYEVEISATGTHLGALDMGGGGVFKATGTKATLALRQLLEIAGDQIVYSSLSFDIQDIVHQLVTVDVPKLLDHLRRIHQLGQKLASTREDDVVERTNLTDRLGTELDSARRTVRPYFMR